MERATQTLNTILASLLEEGALVVDPNWDTFAVLASVTPGMIDVTMYRYTYDGPAKPTPMRSTELELFHDLQLATAAPDGTTWECCIVKLDRDSARGAVKYLYADEAGKWKITPLNILGLGERLRPLAGDFDNAAP